MVYHFKSPDYILHMDAQQDVLLQIYRAFQREGIQFAHPLSVVRVADARDPVSGWPPAGAAPAGLTKH